MFLVISVRLIISTSIGPIFMKFARLVELFDPLKDVATATNFAGKIDL